MSRNVFENDVEVNETDIKKKATAIQQIVTEFEYRLRGYEWDNNGSKYVYNGSPLCQDRIIQKLITLLQPFCKESNLISKKEFNTWVIQRYELSKTANDSLLIDGCPISTYRIVVKSFRNVMQNIGDIILNSKSLMENYINGLPREKDPFFNDLGKKV